MKHEILSIISDGLITATDNEARDLYNLLCELWNENDKFAFGLIVALEKHLGK